MISEKMNPAPRQVAAGLGFVSAVAASDVREISPNLSQIQIDFVVRRTRLRPDLARVVAELAFSRRAA